MDIFAITTRPDFKGIETQCLLNLDLMRNITTRPDFKGIET